MKKVLLVFLATISFFSCQKKGEKDSKSHFVSLPIAAPIRSLDPRIASDSPSLHVANMLYEGLMRLGPNGEILPGVTESVNVSEDKVIYTFHLRDSFWSNGDPVTAYDFEYAWKKSVNPTYAQPAAFTFYVIKNVPDCLEGKVSVDEVGIRALDEKTLEVELEHPAPYFLSLCTCGPYSPIHKKFDLEDPHWANSVNDHFVGNGPFALKKWRKGDEILLEKNPNYWDADVVKIPGIRIQVAPYSSTQFFLFEKGEVDWVGDPFTSLTTDFVVDLQGDDQFNQIDCCGLYWFFLNTEKPPFDNKNFRKALAYALNREEIATHVFQLNEAPAMGILNSRIALQKKPYFKDGDAEKARIYLKKALAEMDCELEDLPTITIRHKSCVLTFRVNQAIQQQLFSVLGLKVEILQTDWPTHFDSVSHGNFQIGYMGWNSWFNDPIYMLDTFRNKSFATNMSRWEHPQYQKLLKKSDLEIHPDVRNEYLRQAEELLMDEMPIIPISFIKLHFLCNKHLKGVYISPLREIDFRYAYFEE